MPELYSAADIVNKTLIAKSKVPIYRLPYDSAEMLGYVNPGESVGLVYAWIDANPAAGRNNLWWQFAPAYGGGSYYYAPHKEGLYNVNSLREQGVITTLEKIEAEKKKQEAANQPWYMAMLKTALPWVAAIALGAAIVNKKL